LSRGRSFFAGEKCNTWRSPRTWFFFNKLRHPLKATGLTDSDEGRREGRRDWWRDWRWAAEIVRDFERLSSAPLVNGKERISDLCVIRRMRVK
jgi:hypothetical protein